jgi:hypothetical protein
MAGNAFVPSELLIVNLVLSELGTLPISAISNNQQAQLIDSRLPLYIQELLLRANWWWAIVYRTDSTPITQDFSAQFTYTFQLPPDFGQIDRFWQMVSDYRFVDNFILCNQSQIQYYYVTNSVDYSVMPPLFVEALVLYTATRVSTILTNNQNLTKELEMRYRQALADAIIQNNIQRRIVSAPNDYDRYVYV